MGVGLSRFLGPHATRPLAPPDDRPQTRGVQSLYFVGPWDLDARLACAPKDPADGPVLMIESREKDLHRQFRQRVGAKLDALELALQDHARRLDEL